LLTDGQTLFGIFSVIYTFWTYRRRRHEKDHGLRLDHFLLSKVAATRLVEAGVDGDVKAETTSVIMRQRGSNWTGRFAHRAHQFTV
jgi:hypothetical protein